MEADAGLLMAMATGQTCLVWDFGSRNKKRGVPRAVWYGLEFLRFAATTVWLKKPGAAFLRGYNVANDWARHVKNFSKAAKKKLRYYAKYVPAFATEVKLFGVYDSTELDNNELAYQIIAEEYLPPDAQLHEGMPDALRPYIEPRVTASLDADKLVLGEAVSGLHILGFSVFFGGVCHSAVAQQSRFYLDSDGGPEDP